MSDYKLTAYPPLAALSIERRGASLVEVDGYALCSLAVPLGGRQALGQCLQTALGLALPAIGNSCLSSDGMYRLLGLQQDQFFLTAEAESGTVTPFVATLVEDKAYVTDQSDSWAKLRLNGPIAREVLMRLCMIDLHPIAFTTGAVVRTVMEHMSVILLKESDESFILFTPRSSAGSFVHAVEEAMNSCAAKKAHGSSS